MALRIGVFPAFIDAARGVRRDSRQFLAAACRRLRTQTETKERLPFGRLGTGSPDRRRATSSACWAEFHR